MGERPPSGGRRKNDPDGPAVLLQHLCKPQSPADEGLRIVEPERDVWPMARALAVADLMAGVDGEGRRRPLAGV